MSIVVVRKYDLAIHMIWQITKLIYVDQSRSCIFYPREDSELFNINWSFYNFEQYGTSKMSRAWK